LFLTKALTKSSLFPGYWGRFYFLFFANMHSLAGNG
jgi:hypothetical protein